LHGVTGSGKTELYLRAIEATLAAGRSAVVLVPEISLAPQTVQRVAGRFTDLVGVWHSHLSAGERRDTWDRAQAGVLRVVVGSRSAVFAPVPRLGLIVLDEEHAESYKQDAVPRYHARDAAIARARSVGAAVLMASATPSVETAWHAERGRFRRAVLTRRVSPVSRDEPLPPPEAPERTYLPLPDVRIVDMRVELRTGNRTIFSRPLYRALAETLAAGQQAILFLNRRGTSTFVLCRGCGHVVVCPACALPLTFHEGQFLLTCHHCGHAEPPPMMCPMCGSDAIRYFGIGTQKVEAAAQEAFPDARILRWDADTTRRKGAHESLLAAFAAGEADILVGTQMVAKGLDLPEVTLVGVVSADTALGLPDFRSSEWTFQLLTQVAGRAGRAAAGGRVIVQTYRPEDPAVVAAATHDYAAFFEREIAFRGEYLYPPYSRLVRLEVQGKTDAAARKAAQALGPELVQRVRALGLPDTEIIGPAPSFFRKVRGHWRWQIVVRSPTPHALLGGWVLPVGWRVDVDPTAML
jgi:primosomal protein N' (replication factor Y)